MLRSVLDSPYRRLLLTGLIIVLVGLGGWLWYSRPITSGPSASADRAAFLAADEPADSTASPQASAAPLGVDVIGAVARPGLYFLPAGARVQDAVGAAGGLAPNANREAMNMSSHLADGQQIRVPRVGDATVAVRGAPPVTTTSAIPTININTADATALATLPGIGAVLAQRIIDYRTVHGPFGAISDLRNVTGIHAGLLDKLKDRLQLGPQP